MDNEPEESELRRKALGRAIQVVRATRGMKRRELAERSGVSYPYLSEIENGKKEASTRAFAAISEALELPLHELIETAEELKPTVENLAANDPSRPMASYRAAIAPASRPFSVSRSREMDRHDLPRAAEGRHLRESDPGPDDLPPREESSETPDLEEFRALASRLSRQDLKRLIDLARRLLGVDSVSP